ncbi:MAG: hypothetical protein ACRYHQ_15480 [Janthinobacterium lividum]
MDATTLGRLRPRSTSPDAIRDALVALQQERAATVQRANSARAKRTAALIAGISWEVGEADKAMKTSADDLEMLNAMEPALEEKLAFAERVEAQGRAQVVEANEAAKAADAAFASALPKYARHAEAINEIARLGLAADQARHHAATLAARQGMAAAQVALPAGAFTASPKGHPLPMASLIRLPAPDGSGLMVGEWGPEHRPAPAFQYA